MFFSFVATKISLFFFMLNPTNKKDSSIFRIEDVVFSNQLDYAKDVGFGNFCLELLVSLPLQYGVRSDPQRRQQSGRSQSKGP